MEGGNEGVVSVSGPALLTSSNHILLSPTIKAQFTPPPSHAGAASLPHAPTPRLECATRVARPAISRRKPLCWCVKLFFVFFFKAGATTPRSREVTEIHPTCFKNK